MAKRKSAPKTELELALGNLIDLGTSFVTPATILEVANKFEVEVWRLEDMYLDATGYNIDN